MYYLKQLEWNNGKATLSPKQPNPTRKPEPSFPDVGHRLSLYFRSLHAKVA